ncbi:MAG: chorismate lyase [Gammaproteobacteria bacterium]|nr:chorismate lyase [Gammaproteobacteria bacterium]
MFPISLPTEWLSADQDQGLISSAAALDWIRSESSLTVRIKELGIAFSLEVLSQSNQPLSPELQQTLATKDTTALFREVLLKQAGIPLIYAQTIMPQSSVTGTEAMLAELGNQPLGQVLFQSPQATRGAIEFAQVQYNSTLATFIEQNLQQPMQEECYIRRSKFLLNKKPLLVCECFLPALFIED